MNRAIYKDLNLKNSETKRKLKVKLHNLIENSDWTKHARDDGVINISDKVLDKDTKCALGYGLNFNINNNGINPIDIAKSFVNLEKRHHINETNISICKGFVYNSLSNNNNDSCPERFLKSFGMLKHDDSIHITKADKSSIIVIMNRTDYVSKMHNILNDNTTYEKLQKKNYNL